MGGKLAFVGTDGRHWTLKERMSGDGCVHEAKPLLPPPAQRSLAVVLRTLGQRVGPMTSCRTLICSSHQIPTDFLGKPVDRDWFYGCDVFPSPHQYRIQAGLTRTQIPIKLAIKCFKFSGGAGYYRAG